MKTTTAISFGTIWKRSTNPDSFSGLLNLTAIANVVQIASGLATGLLAARLLGPQGRGELAAIQSWGLLLGSIATLGMADAVIYFGRRFPEQAGSYLHTAYVPMLFSMAISIGLGYWLMPFLLGAQSPTVIAGARAFLFMMIPMFGTFVWYEALRAVGAWREWNFLRTIPNLIWLGILLIAFLIPGWASSVSLSMLFPICFLFQSIPSILLMRRRISRTSKVQTNLVRPLLSYGVPTVLALLPRTLNLRFDQLIIAIFLPPDSLGLYVAAVTWSGASALLFTALSDVLFPRLSAIHDSEHRNLILARVIRLAAVAAVIFTISFLMITPLFFPLLFGASYSPAIPVVLVLLVANAFNCLNLTLAAGLRGLGKPHRVLIGETFGLVVTLALLLFLLLRLGIMGAAIASLGAYLAVCVSLAISVRQAVRSSVAVAS